MTELKIYSPSAIKVYSECPIKHELKYIDKVLPKEADNAFWGTVAGDGFAVGSAILNTNGHCLGDSILMATNTMLEKVNTFKDAGGLLEQKQLESVLEDVKKALTKYSEADPFKLWTVEHSEYKLPDEYGRPRLDVVGRDNNNVLSFADIKFKRNLATEWVSKTVEEYRYDWQFLHYAWAMRTHFKEPVNAYLLLVRLRSAWQCQLFEFTYDDDLIRMVGQSVVRWSEEMARSEERGPALATTHWTKFGPCPYMDACLKYKFDPTLMKEKYVTVKKVI